MIVIYSALSLWILFIFYLAVMSLFRAYHAKTLSIPAKVLGYPILLVGVLIDAAINLVLFSAIMFEMPKEWLITQRLARHIKRGTGWRKAIAKWVCSNLLDAFDPDQRGHCR